MRPRLALLILACAAFTFSLAVCAQAQTVTFLADFNGGNGWEPYGSVVQATDGNFYGTTSGGIYGTGNVFRMTPAGEITSLYTFCEKADCPTGAFPQSAPILGSDGNLYGVTYGGGMHGAGTVYKMTLEGKITTLYSFCASGVCTDGDNPNAIIQASDGNFYGTTNYGGSGTGVGTIFEVSPAGEEKVLHSFCSQTNCLDGEYLAYPPIQGIDGNLYGTTLAGGTNAGGVLYEVTTAGTYRVLYNFCDPDDSKCPDGAVPTSLVQDAKGDLFGATRSGVGFEFTSEGQFIVLNILKGDKLSGEPNGLTLANDGNLYGTAGAGTLGSIFQLTPGGRYTPLYAFCNCASQGYGPMDPLFQGTDGSLYGTTASGPSAYGYGTVFKFSNGLSPLVETVPVQGSVGASVIILGNNLTGSTSVTFNRVEAAFTVESDSYIKATVPAGATTGTVSVATPSGTLNSNPQFVVTQ